MRSELISLVLFATFCPGLVSTSTPTANQRFSIRQSENQDDNILAFRVSAEILDLYRLDSVEEIQANGNRYLVSEVRPTRVPVARLTAEGDIQAWIVVRKIVGGRSRKLLPYQKNQFLFEHEGAGEYEVTTLDSKREPVFSYFTVNDPDPPQPELPLEPDFSELIRLAQANANSDLSTLRRLGTAWLEAVQGGGTLEQTRTRVSQARADVMSQVRDHDGSWNRFLLAIDDWFASQSLTQESYQAAITALAKWMTN
jgi:hypothetical protein